MGIFDENHKKILSALMTLKNKCTILEKATFYKLYVLNCNDFSFVYANSFYSQIRDICDLSILFMINEEISNATRGQLCGDLLSELLVENHLLDAVNFNEKNIKISAEDFNYSLVDIQKLMSKRVNQIIGSHMHDFSISAFSAFEKWISTLYSCFSSELDKRYYNSRLAKAKKLLDAYVNATEDQCKDKIVERVLKLHGTYISFPDKLNAILNMIEPNSYPRDLSKDKKIIEFLRIHRNTVHNGGVHHGKPISVEYCDTDFSMTPGKPLNSNSWVRSIEFTGELVDIYTNIIVLFSDLPPEAYCSFQEDETALLILEQVLNDYRHSDLTDEKLELQLISFLERKFKLGNEAATNFMTYLREIIDNISPEQEVNIFDLLTKDLRRPSSPTIPTQPT
ncbi:TPA: hypothetical protein PXM42_001530 [Yersinia enterocolitica]|uniref:hypothetical protein n=1 Tax=Yersinia enterocolitica TaxID=630 RepID=UPI00330F0C32|nr:hypothetical protein [Yersinia enterocolitica]